MVFTEEKASVLDLNPMTQTRGSQHWEGIQRLHKQGVSLEAKRANAHRTQKERQRLTKQQEFQADGNEHADTLAKLGADVEEGDVSNVRAATVTPGRLDVYVALQFAKYVRVASLW